MSIKTMAADVQHFMEKHELSNVALIGHSMCVESRRGQTPYQCYDDRVRADLLCVGICRGGRVASALALNPSLPSFQLSSLVLVDVTPLKFAISPQFEHYAESMKVVENSQVKDMKSAMKILEGRGIVSNAVLFSWIGCDCHTCLLCLPRSFQSNNSS
jgi:hypothetical protein